MAILGKRILNVFDAYYYLEGKIALVHENLTSSEISGTATENLIKNGIANKTWSAISSDREVSVTLSSNVIDFNAVSSACGSAIVKGATTAHTFAKVFDLSGTSIQLEETPLTVGDVQIVDVDNDVVLESAKYSITGKNVTFTGVTASQVKVLPYAYTSTADAQEITISASKFPSGGKLLLVSYAVDNLNKITDKVEIEMVAKPTADWTISSASDVSNGNDNTITFNSIADSKGNLGYIRMTPIA